MTHPAYIIGVLDNGVHGITPEALEYIQQADVVIGAKRTLDLFSNEFKPSVHAKDLGEGLRKAPEWIKAAKSDELAVVVLATGDPLCHGIAHYLQTKLDDGACRIIPNVSTLQVAFARLGLVWQKAAIRSVHSKDAGEWSLDAGPEHGLYPVLEAIRHHDFIAIFTSPENSPDRIARMLIAAGLKTAFKLSVAQNLLTEQEQVVVDITLEQAAEQHFSEPNVVVLQRCEFNQPLLFGMDDQRFTQRKPEKGLITKREVRAVSLARMQLHCTSIVWDIGAGSGSVGLEAAKLASYGYVYAIEKNEGDVMNARQNREKMAITNYRIQHGKAPELIDGWADPDAIFIGGSGGELAELIELSLSRLNSNGWLVMNFVTIENLTLATQTLKDLNAVWDVTQLQASRSQPILHMHRMQAENPVWIVSAQRRLEHE